VADEEQLVSKPEVGHNLIGLGDLRVCGGGRERRGAGTPYADLRSRSIVVIVACSINDTLET
jgi:hypothetical protein